MLLLRHILECLKGSSCERALLNDTFATAESHSWFNQAPPEALLLSEMATTRPVTVNSVSPRIAILIRPRSGPSRSAKAFQQRLLLCQTLVEIVGIVNF